MQCWAINEHIRCRMAMRETLNSVMSYRSQWSCHWTPDLTMGWAEWKRNRHLLGGAWGRITKNGALIPQLASILPPPSSKWWRTSGNSTNFSQCPRQNLEVQLAEWRLLIVASNVIVTITWEVVWKAWRIVGLTSDNWLRPTHADWRNLPAW
jgi:hypothetical protein